MKFWPLAIVLLGAAGPAPGADIGRLFFTPAQRAALDATRKQALRGEAPPEERRAAAPLPLPQNVSVDGMVRRSDGKTTVWLNNRPLSEKTAGGMKAAPGRTDNGVRLSIPGSGRSVDLKVGQTVEIQSGTIEEGYSRRTSPPFTTAGQAKTPDPDKSEVAAPAAAPVAEPALRGSRARARELREMREMLEDAQAARAGEKK